ncbi:hypothetical protein BJV74DRAFT_795647 [Russula compacta]|nr:hypothetical protein BJV74DRAFT_795647 [Russula compacta]
MTSGLNGWIPVCLKANITILGMDAFWKAHLKTPTKSTFDTAAPPCASLNACTSLSILHLLHLGKAYYIQTLRCMHAVGGIAKDDNIVINGIFEELRSVMGAVAIKEEHSGDCQNNAPCVFLVLWMEWITPNLCPVQNNVPDTSTAAEERTNPPVLFPPLQTLLVFHVAWKCWALKMIIGSNTLPSVQIVSSAVTFSQFAVPLLCWVFVPCAPSNTLHPLVQWWEPTLIHPINVFP